MQQTDLLSTDVMSSFRRQAQRASNISTSEHCMATEELCGPLQIR